jgi:transposase, IS5 family
MNSQPPPGFFDVERRHERLEALDDLLVRLDRMIQWEAFRPRLEAVFPAPDPSKGGRPPLDRVMMFKVLILKVLYNLSDEQAEYQITDRMSFMRFLGMQPQHQAPDSTSIWLFGDTLAKAKMMESLFADFHQRLSDAGLVLNTGKIIDASMVHAPVQHNTRAERDQLDQCKRPVGWSDRTWAQADIEATWTKKHSKSYHGYKNHIKIDAGSKLIDHYVVTSASVADCVMMDQLLDERDEGQDLYADKGYASKDARELVTQEARMKDRIMHKAARNRPLTAEEDLLNKQYSKVRARVEHVFGSTTKQLGGSAVRCIGLVRTTFQVGLRNLGYNMLRTLHLLTKQTTTVGSV